MLYFIGNHNTIILLQDEKGRFYKAAVNASRRLVLNRERYPILKDFSLQNALIELPNLEVRQHPGGGELWLYDAERDNDVRTVGTENEAFTYIPGWTSLCPTCAGYDIFEMSRAIPCKTIPGWEWICHEFEAIDYFPTPNNLAEIMAKSVAKKTKRYTFAPGPILEPSAGTGNLVRAMDKVFYHNSSQKLDVDCIELSSQFRAILKKDGYRVVHDDFMTFEPHKRYKAIVMNPPFSSGIAHLKKAISIMKNGGAIRCIFPAEYIRHPHNQAQMDIVSTLQDLHADIEYFGSAFSDAERPTSIEVALISIDIPDKPAESKIRLELEKEEQTTQGAKQQENLVSNDPFTAAVEQYNMAAKGLQRIYEEYEGIKDFLGSPMNSAEDPVVSLGKSYNEAVKALRMRYWRALFDIPAIRDNLTESMREEYSERLEELADYDFTKFNILTIRQEIAANTVGSIKAEILKLFDRFTSLNAEKFSNNVHYFNGWKSNSAYKLNEKIVFPCNAYSYWFDHSFDPTYPPVFRMISNIELTLHYLDTSGKPYDSSELRAILNEARKEKQTKKIRCHYFDLTFYRKGTCHLTFTNQDILKAFNAFACQEKNWLPPSYGKKTYEDMEDTEKEAIHSFEGEMSYTDSFNRGLIVTTSKLVQLNA